MTIAWTMPLLREPLEERGLLPARALVSVGDPFQQLGHEHVERAGGLFIDWLGQVVGGRMVALGQPFLDDLLPRASPCRNRP